MRPEHLLLFVFAYFGLLFGVAWVTSRNADNDSFFIGNKRSNWILVSFGMVGTSLSGITFISVPGSVGIDGFGYFQVALGYFLGYLVIAFVLLPVYYRHQVTSIYRYLETRLGDSAYRTGAAIFILSRTLGATARLYLVVRILQDMVLDGLHVPFWLTTLVILAMILLYTYEGGVKTIVWTDTLQTSCMLLGLVVCAAYILEALNLSLLDSLSQMRQRGLATIFSLDPDSRHFVVKQLLAGMFIAIAMTGMDQEMMQKTISVKTLRDSQKNILALGLILLAVILLFLFLGGLLHLYAPIAGIAASGDRLFAAVVVDHFSAAVQMIFIIALISALFPSADGAITALTSSFCIDILRIKLRRHQTETTRKRLRQKVHLSFAALFLILVLMFRWADNPSMIGLILKLAGYTYGPLLGLFAFGILTQREVSGVWVPGVAVLAPLLCWGLDAYQSALFGTYEIGLELLVINGLLTFTGLWLVSSRPATVPESPKAFAQSP